MKTINRIKKNIYLLILGLIITTPVLAQDNSNAPAEKRATDLTNLMTCQLSLTDAQVPKVKAINLAAARQMDAVYKKAQGRMSIVNEEGSKVNEERDAKLRDALSPSQFSLYTRLALNNKHAIKKTAMCKKAGL